MTLIRDLEVGKFYKHELETGERWVLLRKDACVGGFEVEYTTVDTHGVHLNSTWTVRKDANESWPVVLDEYLIEEDVFDGVPGR